MSDLNLRKHLSFGFETTFTLPNWWQSPGFCSECETGEKTKLMNEMSRHLATRLGLTAYAIKDQYDLNAFQIRDSNGEEFVRFTSEPGSIEVNTPPVLLAGVSDLMQAILSSAEAVGLVPYRQWWYGIKTGTGGGCHLNMAGFTEDTNPLKADLGLVLKYFAYFHNRPSLQYPFMGSDLGHGGNCMRIDEQGDATSKNLAKFSEAVNLYNSGWRPQNEELYEFFKGLPLREVKHSSPTLRKMKAPFFLIEDRAVEMPRTPEEFLMLCELRVRILENLQNQEPAELPVQFGENLHTVMISYLSLWQEFSEITKSLGLDPEPFQVFFERQFPKIEMGEAPPKNFFVREGKRQRKVTGVHEMSGSVILTKKIDSRYKRVELHRKQSSASQFRVNGRLIPAQVDGILIDLFVPEFSLGASPAVLDIELTDAEGAFVERSVLDLNSMLWVNIDSSRAWNFSSVHPGRYYNFEQEPKFTLG